MEKNSQSGGFFFSPIKIGKERNWTSMKDASRVALNLIEMHVCLAGHTEADSFSSTYYPQSHACACVRACQAKEESELAMLKTIGVGAP
uniref:Uncharacterized protein n=1 Tax=Arundo donax TaxID=35708 RepID=A0A0A9CDD4_ARUDO